MKSTEEPVDSIAIVDPCYDDYDPLLASFDAQQWRIELYATGEEALRMSSAGATGLWFVNVRLPDMTGTALLKLIRRRQPWISIMLVSDRYSQTDELAARTAGATAYLCKPVTAQWIGYFRRTRRVCGTASGYRTRAAPTLSPP